MKTMQQVEESIRRSLPDGYCCHQEGQRPFAGRGQSRLAREIDRDGREIEEHDASLRASGLSAAQISEMDAAGELSFNG